MSLYPKIQLSKIREIGWGLWDPIGLRNPDGSLIGDCADEYDRYLLAVVSMMCLGQTRADAATYLFQIAADYMGVPMPSHKAASDTSNAIADYLTSLPDGPRGVL
ncbi:hypothetical protein DMC47_40610 [Nostoc sp. 3335mG]|nr:hypothetical protein DMC47_40610 [Nostoc sp. 3335mG]